MSATRWLARQRAIEDTYLDFSGGGSGGGDREHSERGRDCGEGERELHGWLLASRLGLGLVLKPDVKGATNAHFIPGGGWSGDLFRRGQ